MLNNKSRKIPSETPILGIHCFFVIVNVFFNCALVIWIQILIIPNMYKNQTKGLHPVLENWFKLNCKVSTSYSTKIYLLPTLQIQIKYAQSTYMISLKHSPLMHLLHKSNTKTKQIEIALCLIYPKTTFSRPPKSH